MKGTDRVVELVVSYFGGLFLREGGRVMGRVVRGFRGVGRAVLTCRNLVCVPTILSIITSS